MSDQSKVIPQVSSGEGVRMNVYVKMILLTLIGVIVCIIIYNYFMIRVYDIQLNDSTRQPCARMQNMGLVLDINNALSPDINNALSPDINNTLSPDTQFTEQPNAMQPNAMQQNAMQPNALFTTTGASLPDEGVSEGVETSTPEEGRVKVIFYHAGWCPHCVRIMSDLTINHNNKKYSVYGYLKERYNGHPSIKIIEYQQDLDDPIDPLNDRKKENIKTEISAYKKLRGFPTIRCVSKKKDIEYDGPRTKDDIERFIQTF